MKLFDVLLGRTKPASANLDRLFALPGAAITLEASEGLKPSGRAGVCFKPAAGRPFAETRSEMEQLLALDDADKVTISEETDQYGYLWVVLAAAEFDALVTRTHLVNSTLDEHGYGPQLLCSVFGWHQEVEEPGGLPGPVGAASPPSAGKDIYLVYLYKRGTFYPFVPVGDQRRDNEAELRLKETLASDLAIEPEFDRWFPLWALPIS